MKQPSPPNSQFQKVNHYRFKYGLQHRALALSEHQAVKGPKLTRLKPFKQENQRSFSGYQCNIVIVDESLNIVFIGFSTDFVFFKKTKLYICLNPVDTATFILALHSVVRLSG